MESNETAEREGGGFNSGSRGKRNNTEMFSASLRMKLLMSLCLSVCTEPNYSTGEYHGQEVTHDRK